MNLGTTYGLQRRRLKGPIIRFAGILLLAATAHAQYGSGGTVGTMGAPGTAGTSTPSYGHGKAIGIGVGAAAAGVGAVYLITHRASSITGCTEMADDGLRLRDDKTQRTLLLVPGVTDVKPGERVELKGKIKKSAAGNQNFLVKKVAKDFGECHTQANGSAENAATPQGR